MVVVVHKYFTADGSTGEAILYNYGNTRFSTSGVGVTVYNQLDTTNVYATGVTTSIGTFHIRPSSGALTPKISYDDSIADALIFGDDSEARFGGSSDFRIYHDTTGDLNILETHNDREIHIRELDGTNIAKFIPGGSVELYENGTKRLETTDTGVGISSNLTVSGVSTFSNDIRASANLSVTGISTLGSIGISTGIIEGPAIMYIDPATVGDDTGTLVVKGIFKSMELRPR